MKTKNLVADFSYAENTTLSLLYNSYCMNVYGSELWRLNNKTVICVYVTRLHRFIVSIYCHAHEKNKNLATRQ